MYSPYQGRFISLDPSGFDAGDVNLYRAESNNPLNRLDPSGLADKPNIGGKSGELPVDPPILPRFFSPAGKADQLNGVPFFRKDDLPAIPAQANKKSVGTDSWWTGSIGDGWFVGPDGCGPCVGVALVPDKPAPGSFFYVLHFSALGDTSVALKSCGFVRIEEKEVVVIGLGGHQAWKKKTTRTEVVPKGYSAIICGCESQKDESGDNARLRTLRSVKSMLSDKGITIKEYIPAPGFAVDKNGKPRWTTPALTPVDKYEK